MASIAYQAPSTLEQAIALMANPGAFVLAGGTDLLVQYRSEIKRPTSFVDVKRIPELVGITVDEGGARIGAATPAVDICDHRELARLWPGLLDAVRLIGSAQIQGRSTIGGNLCNASPAADTTSALIVEGARCVIAGPSGERSVEVERFCTGPGRTALQRGELLVAIHLPRPSGRTSDAYLRLIPRSEMDIAVVGVAASVSLDRDGLCTAARVAMGAVAPTAILVPAAANALVGSRLDDRALGRAAEAASAAARPIDDKRGTTSYRRTVAGVLTRRATRVAADRARAAG